MSAHDGNSSAPDELNPSGGIGGWGGGEALAWEATAAQCSFRWCGVGLVTTRRDLGGLGEAPVSTLGRGSGSGGWLISTGRAEGCGGTAAIGCTGRTSQTNDEMPPPSMSSRSPIIIT